jgi:hypothetical protein
MKLPDNFIDIGVTFFKSEIEKHTVRETFKERKDRGVYNHHNKDKKAELKNALFD